MRPLHPLPKRTRLAWQTLGSWAGLQRRNPAPRGWVWVGVLLGVPLGQALYSSVTNTAAHP